MNHESANNGSRQSIDSIVITLQVVKPKDFVLLLEGARGFPRARNMQIEYGTHSAYYSMGARIKAAGA